MWCENCQKDNHDASQCWSTYALNTPLPKIDLIGQIVDRAIPPVPRRVVDTDINGRPIYADELKGKP